MKTKGVRGPGTQSANLKRRNQAADGAEITATKQGISGSCYVLMQLDRACGRKATLQDTRTTVARSGSMSLGSTAASRLPQSSGQRHRRLPVVGDVDEVPEQPRVISA
jgi:hypothetical protein